MILDDIQTAINSLADQWGEAGWHSWRTVGETRHAAVEYIQLVETVGGVDQGSHRHLVFEVGFSGGDTRYFKMEGYYASFEGTTWDGEFHEVTPVQQYVTRYEEIS